MTLFTLLRTISVSGPSVILPRRSSSMNPSITFSTTCNGIVTRLVFYQIRNLSVHCSRQRFGVHEGHGNTSHDLSRKKGQSLQANSGKKTDRKSDQENRLLQRRQNMLH